MPLFRLPLRALFPRTPALRAPRSPYRCEGLEPRRLLANMIIGSQGDDDLVVRVEADDEIYVLYNGTSDVVVPAGGDNIVNIHMYGGDDSVWIQNTGVLEFRIYDTAGDDDYRIAAGRFEAEVRRDIEIHDDADSSANTLVVDDNIGDANGTTWEYSGNRLQALGLLERPSILWDMNERRDSVTLNFGRQDDILFVDSFSGLAALTVNAGAGADQLALSGRQLRADYAIPANVAYQFNGGEGTDRLVIEDTNPESTRTSIRVDENALLDRLRVREWENLYVATHERGGAGAEVFFTGSQSPAAYVTIVGTPAFDRVRLGVSGPADLMQYGFASDGGLDLRLGGGQNVVEVTDRNRFDFPNTLRTYVFDGARVNVNGNRLLVSNSPVELTLTGTQYDDTFEFRAVNADWAIRLHGHEGDDQLVHTGGDLRVLFTYPPYFNGGSGHDKILLNDFFAATGGNAEYLVTDGFVGKSDFGTFPLPLLSYDFVDEVSLICDADPNLVRVARAQGLKGGIIDGGGGNDTFVNTFPGGLGGSIGSSMPVGIELRGGAGVDAMEVNDRGGGISNPTAYGLTASQFTWTDGGPMRTTRYGSFDSITIDASDGLNTISLFAKPAAATLTVNGWGGNDTINIGGGDLDSNGFALNTTTVTGGADTDAIAFDDALDATSAAVTYGFDTLRAYRNGGIVTTFTTFEELRLVTADGVDGPAVIDNTVEVNSVSTAIAKTTIVGGNRRSNGVEYGTGNIGFVPGTLAVQFGAATRDRLSLRDQGLTAAQPAQYLVETNRITRTLANVPKTLDHAGVDELFIFGGNGHDSFRVRGVPVGTTLLPLGGGGDDFFDVGDGGRYFDDVRGRVRIEGNAGTDQVRFTNQLDPTPAFLTAVLANDTFSVNGGPAHDFFLTELVSIFSGGLGSDIRVDSVVSPTQLFTGGGDDRITIGNGDLDANLPADVGPQLAFNVGGGFGSDTLVFDDRLDQDAGTDTHVFDVIDLGDEGEPQLFERLRKTSGSVVRTVSASGFESRVFHGKPGRAGYTVQGAVSPLAIRGNTGLDTFAVHDAPAGAPVTIHTGAGGDDTVEVNGDFATAGDAPATAVFDQNDDLRQLQVRSGGVARVTGGAVLDLRGGDSRTPALTLPAGGTLDLANGAVVIRGGNLNTVQPLVASGFHGGDWLGTGVTSSTAAADPGRARAVGYATAGQLGTSSFLGVSGLASGDVIVRQTYFGDTNLDQLVNTDDILNILAAGKLDTAAAATWAEGDMTFDGLVNTDDILQILAAGRLDQS